MIISFPMSVRIMVIISVRNCQNFLGKNDEGLDNPNLTLSNPNLKSFVVLCDCMVPSSLSFFTVFSRSI